MNTVQSMGDYFDRVTILLIKTYKVDNPSGRFRALMELTSVLHSLIPEEYWVDQIGGTIMELMDVNTRLWGIEDRIRNKELPDRERVKLIDQVHELNWERFEMKTFINDQVGSAIFEVKNYDSNRESRRDS